MVQSFFEHTHLILWKFILIHLTLVDLENRPFVADDVWTGAIRRYLSKANVLTFRVGELTRTAEASSREVDFKHLNLLIHPLGKLDPDGTTARECCIEILLNLDYSKRWSLRNRL